MASNGNVNHGAMIPPRFEYNEYMPDAPPEDSDDDDDKMSSRAEREKKQLVRWKAITFFFAHFFSINVWFPDEDDQFR